MQERSLTIMGAPLRLIEDGEGPPLLFLHGAGGANWSPMLKRLAERFHVYAPEHPGFGRSELPDWMLSVGDLSFCYLDVIEALGLRDCHLVGHSIGGWLAAEIAIRDGSRLASLTLMAPAGCAVPEAPFGDIFLWSPEEAARNQFFDQALAEARIAALPTTDQTVALQNKAAAARLAWTPRLHNPQLPQWLHRINVRTQLIWGKQDKIVPAACARVFQAEIPGAALHVIDQCGHSLHTERAAECADFIAAFAGDVA